MKDFKKQFIFFEKHLKQNGYYYNIARLYTLEKYDGKFSPPEIKKYWKEFIDKNKGGAVLENINFYIHVPFCQSRCEYCCFPSWELKEKKRLDEYIKYLKHSLVFYKDIFSKIKFRNIYVGGGTPNILSALQIEKLFGALFKNFNFVTNSGDRIWTYEFNASVGNLSKIGLLKKLGFNRISFGVQSFDDKILLSNGREGQKYENIKNAIKIAREYDFEIINADLIAGFSTDSPRIFAKSFRKLAELEPTTITVYGLYPPNVDYLKRHFKLSYEQFFKKYYSKKVPKLLKEAYRISKSKNYNSRPFSLTNFFWQFNHQRQLDKFDPGKGEGREYGGEFSSSSPSCTFGLGPFSRSYINGALEYQDNNCQSIFNLKEKNYSGRKLTRNDEMVRFIISSLEHGNSISSQQFKKTFNSDINTVFSNTIAALKKFKKIKESKESIHLSFDRPEDKFIYASFFVYEGMVKKN